MEVSTQAVVGSQVKAYFLFIIVINTKTYLSTTYEEKLVLKCKCSSGLFYLDDHCHVLSGYYSQFFVD